VTSKRNKGTTRGCGFTEPARARRRFIYSQLVRFPPWLPARARASSDIVDGQRRNYRRRDFSPAASPISPIARGIPLRARARARHFQQDLRRCRRQGDEFSHLVSIKMVKGEDPAWKGLEQGEWEGGGRTFLAARRALAR